VKEPVWIEKSDALALHDRLLALDGGAAGVRDDGLLESALARPKQHYAYGSAGILQLAAIYTAAILRNHPFVDGNKRTGFLAGILFLELNGYWLHATEEGAVQAVLALAAGKLDEAGYGAFLRANTTRGKRRK
jgi:death on curing protein